MAITKMGIMLLVVVGLLAMIQQSVQMSGDVSMLRETGNDLSSWAIVFSRKTSERVLLESGDYEHRSSVIIAGRVFRSGFLSGRPVVLVNTGKYSTNVASALQIALVAYHIRGVLFFGLAGDLTGSLPIGTVVVPRNIAFTGIWDWLALNADKEGDLVFGDFNLGGNPQNLLGSVQYKNVTLYTGENVVSYPFYLQTPEEWIKIALKIKTTLPDLTIHVGRKASSSDISVRNKAYASFLRKRFGFAIADQESATVALVSKSNDTPFIVFRGVSNSATGGSGADLEAKIAATENAYLVLKTFLNSLPQPRGHLTAHV